ncbi:YozQ family protein [Paenibacillus sp. GYB003]|uniref:YozQ family protein n=1 Tax=Paenibacillus sp. GYB003 TaxID=2994392 RepID=UPI002F960C00
MANEAKASLTEHAEEVAEQTYTPSGSASASEVARGLAETHEQANDAYVAGTSDGAFVRERENESDRGE